MTEASVLLSKEEKAVRSAGRTLGSLGSVMVVLGVIPSILYFSAVTALSQIAGAPFPMQVVFNVVLAFAVGAAVWFLGSYIHKQPLTGDTTLYFKLCLGIGILMLIDTLMVDIKNPLSFYAVLYSVFIGTAVFGMTKLKKISFDSNAKDPKRMARLVLATVALLVTSFSIIERIILA